jgi:hypothetical protein
MLICKFRRIKIFTSDLCVFMDRFIGENDVEYAEFSMTQRLMMRDTSPAAAGATALSPTEGNSFEDKLMLLQLFDRIENSPQPTSSSNGKCDRRFEVMSDCTF